MQKTKLAFNAIAQEVQEAVVTIDLNGEYLFTFADKSFFKLPGSLDKKGVNEALAAYQKANEGQISQASVNADNAEKLKNI